MGSAQSADSQRKIHQENNAEPVRDRKNSQEKEGGRGAVEEGRKGGGGKRGNSKSPEISQRLEIWLQPLVLRHRRTCRLSQGNVWGKKGSRRRRKKTASLLKNKKNHLTNGKGLLEDTAKETDMRKGITASLYEKGVERGGKETQVPPSQMRGQEGRVGGGLL